MGPGSSRFDSYHPDCQLAKLKAGRCLGKAYRSHKPAVVSSTLTPATKYSQNNEYMKKSTVIKLGLLTLAIGGGVVATACVPEVVVPFETDREIVVHGLDANGNQFRTVLDIRLQGEVPNPAFGNSWVDNRTLSDDGQHKSGAPVLESIIENRLQNISAVLGDADFKSVLLADAQKGLNQFNQETITNQTGVYRLEASFGEDPVGSVIDYYATAYDNLQTFVEGQDEFYKVSSAQVSATDSDRPGQPGYGLVSGSVINVVDTETFGQVVHTYFQCPATAKGACKIDAEKTEASKPRQSFTNVNGLEGGNNLNVVPVNPNVPR